jgi:hypothetical protein
MADLNGIASHSDTTPKQLQGCLEAILQELEPQMPVRAYRAYWGHALAVKSLDREKKEVVFTLPANRQQIKALEGGRFPGKLTKACTAVGLQSWTILPG